MMRLLILLASFGLPVLAYAQGTDFIPLLPSLPGITEVSSANSIAPLLSQIYKICIGLAAVLAVLQIMRAGILYMGGDSITEKKEARGLIGTALAGLLLVLSPVIVFSIINPDILNLNIGGEKLQITAGDGVADFSRTGTPTLNDLGQESNAKNDVGGATIAPPPTAAACTATIKNSQILTDSSKDRSCCASQTNTYVTCQVQARTRSVNGVPGSVEYCGCSIRPNIGFSYYELYSAPYYQSIDKLRYESDLKKLGLTPSGKAEVYNSTESGCKAAGGKFEAKPTRNFLQSTYISCPADAGAPASSKETVYRCKPMQATCTSQ